MKLADKKKSVADYIRSELLIGEGETPALAYFLALFFLLGLGLALGRGSANALFLKRFGVAYLPQVYVALSVCLGVASLGYAALADRITPEKLFAALTGLFAAVLCVLWASMYAGREDLASPFYLVTFNVISEVIALHATLYFGANFDGGQTKRLLPIALAGIQAGELCGGLALAALAAFMPLKDILLVWAAICAASLALIVRRHRRFGGSPFAAPPRRGAGALRAAADQILQGLRFAQQSELLRYSSYAVLFMVIAVFTMSYSTMAVYTASFRSEAELGIVFGLTTFVGGTVALLVQVFYTGKLLQRFGVRKMNLVFPLTTLVSFAGLLLSFTLPLALVAAFNRRVIMPAIRNPSRNLLFQALPDYMQGRARALSLVLVLPLGIFVAGVLLRLLKLPQLEHQPWMLPALGMLAALAYLAYSAKTNRAYLGAVLSTMAERLYIPREHIGELDSERDQELFGVLARGAAHQDEQISLTYAKVLTQAFPSDAWRIVLNRLSGASSRTQDQLIRLIVPSMPAAEIGVLYDRLGSSDPHQQATILGILFELRDEPARLRVMDCLRSSNPRLVASGILGVYCYDAAELRDEAGQRWNALLNSDHSPSLLAGLDLLRQRPEAALFDPAARLLSHADDRVKRAALLALEQFASVDAAALARQLQALLHAEDHALRIAALRCTRQLSEDACRSCCLEALEDRHPQVVQTALEVLGRLHARDFAEMAMDWLDGNAGSPRAQRALIESLLRRHAPRDRLAAFARGKLAEALTLAGALRLVARPRAAELEAAGMELLGLALQEKLDRVVALALTALEAVEDRQLARTIRAGLLSKDSRQVARAFEAVEDLRARDIVAMLRLVYERAGPRDRALSDAVGGTARFSKIGEVLDYFRGGCDAWLRECAACAQPATAAGAT